MTTELNTDNVKKPLSVKQACSKWVNKFAEDFLKEKEYSFKELEKIKYDYIRLINHFTDDNIEDIVIGMFKDNYSVLSYFNNDKENVSLNIDKIFRNNGCINEFMEDFSLFIKNVVEPLGQNKHEIFITETRKKLNEFDKIDKVYNTGILEWDFVQKQFDRSLDFWKVKEAIAWLVGYVENNSYELSELFILNSYGKIDKQKTFNNLIEKVNEVSLTQKNPFYKTKDKLYFNDAKGGEVDVMMWNQTESKIISMSATRDRGYKIEGNQFPRHYFKSIVVYDSILEYEKRHKFLLTSKNVQKLVRNDNFKKYNEFQRLKDIDLDLSVRNESSNLNVLARDLSFVRETLKNKLNINYHKNGLEITDKELSSIIAYADSKVDFIFFGEILERKHMPTVQAGLNCIAYRDNFKRLGKFRMTNNASNIFMRRIGKRFNNISASEKNVDKYGQDFLISLIKNVDNTNKNIENIQYFSEGNVYAEERSCLFKSCSVLFRNVITELDKMDNILRNDKELDSKNENLATDAIEKGLKFFFDQGIDKEDLNKIVKFFTSKEEMDKFIINFDTIKTAISEVPLELEELEFCKERVVASYNNVKDIIKIKELKIENEIKLSPKNDKIKLNKNKLN